MTGKVQDFFLCSLLLCNISAGWCDCSSPNVLPPGK
ncbi:RepA leader peptide Tap, partial [Escherichia coli]|nr:RepA leader peptide Tap [Escherichia coli]